MLSQYVCTYLSKTTGILHVVDCCFEDSCRVLYTTKELREVLSRYHTHRTGIKELNKRLESQDIKKYGQIGHC